MNIGSAASVGKGLSVLGKTIGLNDVLDALNVVISTIEHSNVTGGPGGFAVKASMKNTASDASADDVLGDLQVRFLVVIFRIQTHIISHISLVRLQLAVMLETYSLVV